MEGREDAGERGFEGVVLAGVLLHGFCRERPGYPAGVEGMAEQVAPADAIVDLGKNVHERFPPHRRRSLKIGRNRAAGQAELDPQQSLWTSVAEGPRGTS